MQHFHSNSTPLYSFEEIIMRIKEISTKISNDYNGKDLHIVSMLNGASFFVTDMVKHLSIPTALHHFGFSSYKEANQTGEINITRDVAEPLYNKHILLIEGVVVSGRTPKFVRDYFSLRKPASIKICALGVKPKLLIPDLIIDYSCFEFADEVVVGYGIGTGHEKCFPFLINKSDK